MWASWSPRWKTITSIKQQRSTLATPSEAPPHCSFYVPFRLEQFSLFVTDRVQKVQKVVEYRQHKQTRTRSLREESSGLCCCAPFNLMSWQRHSCRSFARANLAVAARDVTSATYKWLLHKTNRGAGFCQSCGSVLDPEFTKHASYLDKSTSTLSTEYRRARSYLFSRGT